MKKIILVVGSMEEAYLTKLIEHTKQQTNEPCEIIIREQTNLPFIIKAMPRMDMPFIEKPKRKGHERPYKYHP